MHTNVLQFPSLSACPLYMDHTYKYRFLQDAMPSHFASPKTFRVMLEPSEVVEGEEGGLSVTLPAADSRTAHVRGVLKGENGECLRVGVVNAGR